MEARAIAVNRVVSVEVWACFFIEMFHNLKTSTDRSVSLALYWIYRSNAYLSNHHNRFIGSRDIAICLKELEATAAFSSKSWIGDLYEGLANGYLDWEINILIRFVGDDLVRARSYIVNKHLALLLHLDFEVTLISRI